MRKKMATKSKSQHFQKLGHSFPPTKDVLLFVLNFLFFIIFFLIIPFLIKLGSEYHKTSFETSFAEIEDICWQRAEFKNEVKNIFSCGNFTNKKYNFILNVRKWNNRLPLETLFVEIGWDFSEIFDSRYYLGLAADKNAI